MLLSRVLPNAMSESDTALLNNTETALSKSWNVLILDDPVNLMEYVTWVLMRLFGFSRTHAEKLMIEVHTEGKSVVWSGTREQAEHYVQQLHAHQLRATLEQSS